MKFVAEGGDWRPESRDQRPAWRAVDLYQVVQLLIPPIRFTMARMICRSDSLSLSIFLCSSASACWLFIADAGSKPAWRMTSSDDTPKARASSLIAFVPGGRIPDTRRDTCATLSPLRRTSSAWFQPRVRNSCCNQFAKSMYVAILYANDTNINIHLGIFLFQFDNSCEIPYNPKNN